MRHTNTKEFCFYLKFRFNGGSVFYQAALLSEVNPPKKKVIIVY